MYEGRFRDDQMDGMGTFNMPNAVFIPKIEPPPPPLDKDIFDTSRSSTPIPSTTEGEGEVEMETREPSKPEDLVMQPTNPEDIWIVPINLAQDIAMIHFLAGFDKEGM